MSAEGYGITRMHIDDNQRTIQLQQRSAAIVFQWHGNTKSFTERHRTGAISEEQYALFLPVAKAIARTKRRQRT